MRLTELEPAGHDQIELGGKRVLIFVVAYNAESTIEKVLGRIPKCLGSENVEVLIIDDSSKDETFRNGLRFQSQNSAFKITVLRTPKNQGYGGNQKLGYRYAIDNGFDVVALVHGDGQYAPEKLPELLAPLIAGMADAVFGSRMIDRRAARQGGMPLYKWVGNQILTGFQNRFLGTNLSEFHSGYRLYSTAALAQVPFEKNTNDFHFDTEIIIQFVLRKLHIAELPIPTFYGDEICHVNGMKYAWDVCKATAKARLCGIHLFYDRKFDVHPADRSHSDKLAFVSSQSFAVESCRPGAAVLQLGIGHANVAAELRARGCEVTAIDFTKNDMADASDNPVSAPMPEPPRTIAQQDYILLMDLIEHVHDPEAFIDQLRRKMAGHQPEVIVTAANVAFFVTRFMLAFGQFNYSKKGILGLGHRRLFTFQSLRSLLEQAGYEIIAERGVPAPFPLALGTNRWSRLLLRVNHGLIAIAKRLFSYQICLRARALPEVKHLLTETVASSSALRVQILDRVA
ncbi:MAG TPA: bifunctional glycosyltransferase/class I SAM-dependent methyltransferase [Chthoniobacterales bacterium]|nr:bifunctional glycosyltransferase/class I SAM-dependent methyltransferase [Chthoniobacterales bacterium]